MPKTEFARMVRSDHSMRPPMPAATIAFGSPNACNICHTNRTAQWANQVVQGWHHDDYQAPTIRRASWIASARKADWSKLPEIVDYLAGSERQEVWAASLIELLRQCNDQLKWKGIVPCLKDRSPLVRVAAVDAIGDRLQPESMAPLLDAVKDRSRLVRLRAASVLAGAPMESATPAERKSLAAASEELLTSFLARPDAPASYHNLGNFRLQRRELLQSIEAFETAIKLQPQDIASLVNVALAYNMTRQNDLAEARLRRALQFSPTNSDVNLNMGMLMAEMQRFREAETAFRIAFKSNPRSAQAAFNLGVILATQQPEEALTWCRRAMELRPDEPRYAYTLAYFQHERSINEGAIETLRKLVEQSPAYPAAYALLARIYQEQHQDAQAAGICRKAASNENLSEADRAQFLAQARAIAGE